MKICKTNGPHNVTWVEVPKEFIVCKICDGAGEISYMGGYGYPTTRYYKDCWYCNTRGFVKNEKEKSR